MKYTFADRCYDSFKSIVKIALQSRRGASQKPHNGKSIIVMGNGPSLAQTIATKGDILKQSVTMAVNFAALSPDFFAIKPQYYVLADPHFFGTPEPGSNLELLRQAFARIDWPMTLFIPAKAPAEAYTQPGIEIRRFNTVGVEGFHRLAHWAYRRGLGMPRPRNVLIPAIMLAIAEGYSKVMIAGADHSWMQSISVTDDNEVVSVQPHFYTDSKNEEARVRHEYKGYRLHEIVQSFAVAFKSYHDIAAYARERGTEIVNVTPGSFIDAFPRGEL
ncbi:MAG: hypothetical protein NC418_02015 [Muribaculaceae bacterium]|nr:hypothetical protein [Muribaculaceae bacterium]